MQALVGYFKSEVFQSLLLIVFLLVLFFIGNPFLLYKFLLFGCLYLILKLDLGHEQIFKKKQTLYSLYVVTVSIILIALSMAGFIETQLGGVAGTVLLILLMPFFLFEVLGRSLWIRQPLSVTTLVFIIIPNISAALFDGAPTQEFLWPLSVSFMIWFFYRLCLSKDAWTLLLSFMVFMSACFLSAQYISSSLVVVCRLLLLLFPVLFVLLNSHYKSYWMLLLLLLLLPFPRGNMEEVLLAQVSFSEVMVLSVLIFGVCVTTVRMVMLTDRDQGFLPVFRLNRYIVSSLALVVIFVFHYFKIRGGLWS